MQLTANRKREAQKLHAELFETVRRVALSHSKKWIAWVDRDEIESEAMFWAATKWGQLQEKVEEIGLEATKKWLAVSLYNLLNDYSRERRIDKQGQVSYTSLTTSDSGVELMAGNSDLIVDFEWIETKLRQGSVNVWQAAEASCTENQLQAITLVYRDGLSLNKAGKAINRSPAAIRDRIDNGIKNMLVKKFNQTQGFLH